MTSRLPHQKEDVSFYQSIDDVAPKPKSRFIPWAIIGFFVLVVFVLVGLFIVGGNDENPQPAVVSEPANDSAQTQEQPQDQEVSAEMLQAGMRAKQAEFEAADPEYPSEERIVYEMSALGTSTPELHPADAQLWDLVQMLAPTGRTLDSIVEFEVYFDEADDTLASVESRDDTNSAWLFSINYIAVTDFEELIPTIIHEHAHILTLQDSQTTTELEDQDIRQTCQGYLVIEGCLNQNSFLNTFFERFWKDSPAFIGDADRTSEQAAAFYADHPDDFVTEYATTNAAEDFAESFMAFALEDPPSDDTLASAKIAFFSEFDALELYRSNARQIISSWAE